MKVRTKCLIWAVTLSLVANHSANSDCPTVCGDVNCSGSNGLADPLTLMEYLFNGGSSFCEDCGDIDQYAGLTLRDVTYSNWRRFFAAPPSVCPPPNGRLVPTVDTSYVLRYTNMFPAGQSQALISFQLTNPTPIQAVVLSMRLRVASEILQVDSLQIDRVHSNTYLFVENIIFHYPTTGFFLENTMRRDSGVIIFAAHNFIGGTAIAAGSGELFALHVTAPPAPDPRPITVEYTIESALAADPPDSALFPMLIEFKQSPPDSAYPTWEPVLVGVEPCCERAGDANNDGLMNISDITFMIAMIFAGGDLPVCKDQADANSSFSVNISDVTYLIATIFAGGPAPECGRTHS